MFHIILAVYMQGVQIPKVPEVPVPKVPVPEVQSSPNDMISKVYIETAKKRLRIEIPRNVEIPIIINSFETLKQCTDLLADVAYTYKFKMSIQPFFGYTASKLDTKSGKFLAYFCAGDDRANK
ncbi:MAG: hypothetical protein ACI9RI_000871 [Oceanospirillaceae bacterium]|jgi:hypothetical protein